MFHFGITARYMKVLLVLHAPVLCRAASPSWALDSPRFLTSFAASDRDGHLRAIIKNHPIDKACVMVDSLEGTRPCEKILFHAGTGTASGISSTALTLRGGASTEDFVGDAYDWCNNLGGPAALIAGAVIATLYENHRGGSLELRKGDSTYVMGAKKMTNLLLLSAFAFQIVCIFVTTVTGTMLRSRDFTSTTTTAHSAMSFLREHFEFEFLTSRLSFMQGLVNWLAGVALEHTIPRRGEGGAARKMDQFVAVSLGTLIVLLLSFYNTHLSFYGNYWQMVLRWTYVTTHRYMGQFRPLSFIYIPGAMFSIYKGILAWQEGAYSEDSDDN